jgi:hypothetical protein
MNTAHKHIVKPKTGITEGKAMAGVQAKLEINAPGDQYEQEADAMAESVMRMQAPGNAGTGWSRREVRLSSSWPTYSGSPIAGSIRRKCAECEKEEEEDKKEGKAMRKAEGGGGFEASPALSSQLDHSRGGGTPLPDGTRNFMEHAFSKDFSDVRVHTDGGAAEMSKGIRAKAFTYGRDIYFNTGQFTPGGTEGRRLLAHELTHVLQQQNGTIRRAEARPKESGKVIVDDESSPAQGQMRKTPFLAHLKEEVCRTVNDALRGTRYTSENCPYLRSIFSRHQHSPAASLEDIIRRYEPSARQARNAEELIRLIQNRVFSAASRWAKTGDLSGIPRGETPSVSEPAPSVMRKGMQGGVGASPDPQTVMHGLGEGNSMDSRTRGQMEMAFGTSFSNVAIHTDSRAADLASGMNARAFTVGNHIAFASGEHRPGTLIGDALMAHELAHVLQQSDTHQGATRQAQVVDHQGLEHDADMSAVGAVLSTWSRLKGSVKNIGRTAMPRLRTGLKLQRCPAAGVAIFLETAEVGGTVALEGAAVSAPAVAVPAVAAPAAIGVGVLETAPAAAPLLAPTIAAAPVVAAAPTVAAVTSSLSVPAAGLALGATLLPGDTTEPEHEGRGRWGCDDVRCTVYQNQKSVPLNPNCPPRVIGRSRGHATEAEACLAAQIYANLRVPRGCVKRHCNCKTKCRKY